MIVLHIQLLQWMHMHELAKEEQEQTNPLLGEKYCWFLEAKSLV